MGNEHGKSTTSQSSPQEAGGHDATGMGSSGPESPTSGDSGRERTYGKGHTSRSSGGEPLQDSQAAGDHLRSRYPKGIWPEDLDEVERQLTQAFQQGNPVLAWSLTQKLLETARALMVEAAKARFEVNFGTPTCERCEGLRAGDGVVATCYQMKLCYYRNTKKETTPKQQGIIDSLLGSARPPGRGGKTM